MLNRFANVFLWTCIGVAMLWWFLMNPNLQRGTDADYVVLFIGFLIFAVGVAFRWVVTGKVN